MTLTPRERALIDAHDPFAFDAVDDEPCQECGGEGVTFSCFDGFCADAEVGCDDCTRACPECARHERNRRKAICLSIMIALDVDAAIAWMKQEGRYQDFMTRRFVLLEMHRDRTGMPEFSDQDRADSACWVEGLI